MALMFTKDTKRLLENFLSLAFLRGFSRVLPLIITPFLFRTLGMHCFGTIEFIKAFSYYFIVFTEFGFHYSATRQISLYRNEPNKVNEIHSCLLILKTVMVFAIFLVVLAMSTWLEQIKAIRLPLLLYFPTVIANCFFPIWIFQGFEKMKVMTLINITGKFLFMIGLFVFIRSPQDFLIYPIALSTAETIRVLFSLYYAHKHFHLKLTLPSFDRLLFQIKDGLHIFLSNVSISIYSRLPTIFLGFYSGPIAVSIYSVGVRIVRSLLGMIDPLTQAIFPYLSRKLYAAFDQGVTITLRILKISGSIALIISLWTLLFAKPLVYVMSGTVSLETILVLKIVSFLPFVVVLSNIIGIQILINLEKRHEYAYTMLVAGIFCALILWFLVPAYSAIGAAIGILATEIFATLLIGFFGWRAIREKRALLNLR
jgi:PST family polysaccharide transporter